MHPRLPLTAVVAIVSLAATGCVRRYVEPAPSEPHAIVKFRFLHHVTFRDDLDESLLVDGTSVPIPDGVRTEARLRAVRVRPLPARYQFHVEYFHFENRMRLETRLESYNCGSYSRPQTCTRSVTVQVHERWRVTDAACNAGLSHAPLAGAIYLVQFDFFGHDTCSASCFRQIPGVGGDFELVPCGLGEPPVEIGAGGEILVTTPTPTLTPTPTPTPTPTSREGADGLASPFR